MERCPVCGEQRRNGARFCTTCGSRFAAEETAEAVPAPPELTTGTTSPDVEPVIPGWPSPPTQDAESPWASASNGDESWPAPPTTPLPVNDAPDVTWAEAAAAALTGPDRPTTTSSDFSEEVLVAEIETITEVDTGLAREVAASDDAVRQRARALIDELRTAIDDLTGETSASQEDIANELEVALVRPAALDGDALANLRTAAEAARERPRDLDTLTALTAQAEIILALLVSYERATAGIERALETARPTSGE